MNIKKIFSCLFAAISLFFFFSCGGSASDSSISFPDSVSDTLSNSETSSDIKPHTHTFGNWRETLAKTCVRDGMQTRECTICGYSETHSLPASGHLFSDGICGSCGTAEPTDGLIYEISQDGSHYLCTGIGTAGTAIVVSDFFEGKRVTEIASGAFQESGLVSVTVPAGIEKIGGGAFYRCETLTAVTLCEGLTQIGANAFSRCAFSSFSMPDTLITVGTGAFQQCTKLRKINFSQTLESIGNSAFQGCTTITAIELPATLTQIGQSAFYGCSRLSSLTLPSALAKISANTFANCASLSSIVLPAELTEISTGAFSGCVKLSSLDINGKLEKISKNSFSFCPRLSYVILSESVKEIEGNAFEKTIVYSLCAAKPSGWAETISKSDIYFYSETDPIFEGNYWHYTNGVPTSW